MLLIFAWFHTANHYWHTIINVTVFPDYRLYFDIEYRCVDLKFHRVFTTIPACCRIYQANQCGTRTSLDKVWITQQKPFQYGFIQFYFKLGFM
ncbi:hypothetical protein D6C00_02315 [Thiohalobacter thiocyanaticus]|uniref:Uncharacterized protein n=1 Tax=Thiohalobacter thiocyanaticus TaxID=585455 RepID=A0A426QGN6_9GAMM|nr:hypothetical protein D6C00_02315 [Thiohalobacter thiocyanaticus]